MIAMLISIFEEDEKIQVTPILNQLEEIQNSVSNVCKNNQQVENQRSTLETCVLSVEVIILIAVHSVELRTRNLFSIRLCSYIRIEFQNPRSC